jgi:hypothetical protein
LITRLAQLGSEPDPRILQLEFAMEEQLVGIVSHYFGKAEVAGITLSAELSVGDFVEFKGYTTDFSQEIASMQIDRVPVAAAEAGSDVGVKVSERVRVGDRVYKVEA